MPYVKNESYETPDENIKIWRYMDFVKFVHLIGTRKLFLCPAGCLGDSQEGRMPESFLKALEAVGGQTLPPEAKESLHKMGIFVDSPKELFEHAFTEIKSLMYINCWHMSEHESEAMWRGYAANGIGVAIQSTIKKLIESTAFCTEKLYIGSVEYTDHENFGVDGPSPFIRYVKKGLKFKHEQEVRVLCIKDNVENLAENRSGIEINVNLEKLLDAVYLPAGSEKWIAETVQMLLTTYKIKVPVRTFKE